MAFGLTDAGFEIKRLADIKTEMEAKVRSVLGSATNLAPETALGQLIAIFSERESFIWEELEDIYLSAYPDTARGVSLDNVVGYTGTTRQGAQPSRQLLERLFGTAGALIPAGTIFSVQNAPTSRFKTDFDVTLAAGADERQKLTFSAVPTAGTWRLNYRANDSATFAFNATSATIQASLRTLPFGADIVVTGNYSAGLTIDYAGAAGKQEQDPIGIDLDLLVNGITAVTISVVTQIQGQNQGLVDLTALATGPAIAPAGTLTVIETPVSGLASILNLTDAGQGRDLETDAELRIRRAKTLQVAGKATVDAIRSALLSLSGVTDVIVFENDTMIPDSNGRPAKSFEAVVNGGNLQTIFDKIWDVKAAGIRTFGSQVGSITDSQGQPHTVQFSRPTQLPVYLEVDLTTNSQFPANGLVAARQSLVDVGNAAGIGKNVVVYPTLISALNSIPGITDVAIRIGLAPSPTTDDNIIVAANQVAVFDTSKTQVVSL